jgi:hypothetical protein
MTTGWWDVHLEKGAVRHVCKRLPYWVLSLLALLVQVQKYKYWHLRRCFSATRSSRYTCFTTTCFTTTRVLALLVQKHKYWHLRRWFSAIRSSWYSNYLLY